MAGNKAKSQKQRKAHQMGRKRRKTKNKIQGYSLTVLTTYTSILDIVYSVCSFHAELLIFTGLSQRLSGLGLAACIASALPVWFFNSSYYGAKSYSTKPDYVSKVFKHDSNAFTCALYIWILATAEYATQQSWEPVVTLFMYIWFYMNSQPRICGWKKSWR